MNFPSICILLLLVQQALEVSSCRKSMGRRRRSPNLKSFDSTDQLTAKREIREMARERMKRETYFSINNFPNVTAFANCLQQKLLMAAMWNQTTFEKIVDCFDTRACEEDVPSGGNCSDQWKDIVGGVVPKLEIPKMAKEPVCSRMEQCEGRAPRFANCFLPEGAGLEAKVKPIFLDCAKALKYDQNTTLWSGFQRFDKACLSDRKTLQEGAVELGYGVKCGLN